MNYLAQDEGFLDKTFKNQDSYSLNERKQALKNIAESERETYMNKKEVRIEQTIYYIL